MRELAVYDYHNYKAGGTVGRRPSIRGIIRREGRVALVHSLKYDYYKFPGGGAENGERHAETLIREVAEETGLVVIPESIKEYGLVIRKEKGGIDDIFLQENFYYFCEAEENLSMQKLDDYEEEERFVLEWAEPELMIETNLFHNHSEKSSERARHMMERDANVMKLLMEEGYC